MSGVPAYCAYIFALSPEITLKNPQEDPGDLAGIRWDTMGYDGIRPNYMHSKDILEAARERAKQAHKSIKQYLPGTHRCDCRSCKGAYKWRWETVRRHMRQNPPVEEDGENMVPENHDGESAPGGSKLGHPSGSGLASRIAEDICASAFSYAATVPPGSYRREFSLQRLSCAL
ncbi:hypothetical protein BDV93DRAFT_515872 [Ceratobasidium sp. AG-I]|nr:hypothetical protein BDV93DRAFT_515872 [Ceratobasidium sp. AG-I]